MHQIASRQTTSKISCWVVTDGKPGMENQCLGLADAMGLTPTIKRVALRQPWRRFGPYFRIGGRHAASADGDPLAPPWPDLVIASGRQSIVPGLAVKRAARGRTFLIQIQDPGISPRHFDLVIAPEHDRVRGPNVLTTKGALHRVTPTRLAASAAGCAARLEHLPRPRLAVLIGGTNAVYQLTPTVMGDVAEQLAELAKRRGVGLMVTPSRRTGADNEAILRARFAGLPAEIWDGEGENPYFAYLGLADTIVVTADSVNMVCEAASTGKPVYVVELEGGSGKFRAFHEAMRQAGITRPFDGTLESWTYTPLREPQRVAAEVWRRLAGRTVPTATAASRH